MPQRNKDPIAPRPNQSMRRREVKLRVTGGSYATIAKRLPHPYGPSFEMIASGIKEMLETNHFDAAVILAHALADLLDDHCLRTLHNEHEER